MNDFELLLDALGLTVHEFKLEQSKFQLSPTAWLDEKLRAKGYTKPQPPQR